MSFEPEQLAAQCHEPQQLHAAVFDVYEPLRRLMNALDGRIRRPTPGNGVARLTTGDAQGAIEHGRLAREQAREQMQEQEDNVATEELAHATSVVAR
jgi:hypothetical protein